MAESNGSRRANSLYHPLPNANTECSKRTGLSDALRSTAELTALPRFERTQHSALTETTTHLLACRVDALVTAFRIEQPSHVSDKFASRVEIAIEDGAAE